MTLFKSMTGMENTAGTMFPGTIVPNPLELPGLYAVLSAPKV
jgi:hypothetical protein